MWEPFTEHARHSVAQAHDEAQAMGQAQLGTEHLLLALLAQTTVETVLEGVDVDVEALRRELKRDARRDPCPPGQEMGFTRNAKKAIECAFEAARLLHHDFIACEHLLIGILRAPDCTACRALAAAGADPKRLGKALQERASETPRPPETLHLQAQAARAHAARGEVLPSAVPVGQEALELLRSLREEVAAMRTEIAGLRQLLAATPPEAT